MESIYPPRRYVCTGKLTDLKEHFDVFAEECYRTKQGALTGNESIEETFCKLYGGDFDVEKLKERSEICSTDNLTVPDELKPIDVSSCNKYAIMQQKSIPEAAKTLNTIQAKIHWDKKGKRNPKDTVNVNLTHNFSKTIDFAPGSEILINVRVHHPFPYLPTEKIKVDFRFGFFRCSHEIVALGSQSLKDLRDKILCANDTGSSTEVEDIFKPPQENVAQDEFSSSLICLDNKLYIDTPRPDSIDYSIVIKEWANEKELKENFTTEHMKDVKLSELNFRLGYPYVFQHRGNCEHIFVFSDVRLAKRSDSLCSDDYPYYARINRYNKQHCNFCQKIFAQWVCTGSDRLVHNLTFLCHDCMVSFNYIDGKKIGDFKVYPYNNKTFITLPNSLEK